ncbi:glucosyltransferase [Mortierella alpina]|nr:glucosyltransferase [Mortierella alpina]
MLLSKPLTVITMAMPNLGLLAGFVAFVKWNGGIVLGDKSNHVPITHVVQLFYFAVFSAGMSVFAILGGVPLARLLKRPSSSRSWTVILVIATIMAACIKKFTYVHPFLLADNRHYTFYLCKLVLRNQAMPYALIPIYMVSAYFCWQALATEQTLLWVTIYAVATALTLIPSPLIEFRYFITPYLIYRIAMRQSRGIWLVLEFLLYSAINAFTVWMFLSRPFQWSHEEGVQRFMW